MSLGFGTKISLKEFALRIILGLFALMCVASSAELVAALNNNMGWVVLAKLETRHELLGGGSAAKLGKEMVQFAESRFTAAVNWHQDSSRAWRGLMHLRVLAEQYDAAADAFERARTLGLQDLAIHPGEYRYHLLEALLEARASKWEKAVRDFQWALGLGLGTRNAHAYPLFDQLLAASFGLRVRESPDNPRWHYLFGKYLERSGQTTRAYQEYEWIVNEGKVAEVSSADLGDAFYKLANREAVLGNNNRAIELYTRALDLNPRIVPAYYHLMQLYAKRGALDKVLSLKSALAALQPEYKVNQEVALEGWFLPGSDNAPRTWVLDKSAKCRWTLLGYDLDEEALESGARIEMTLYWRADDPTVEPEPRPGKRWYKAGDHWIEIREVQNLAPNAGFEWDDSIGFMYPFGYHQLAIYHAPVESYSIVADQRFGKTTKVAALTSGDPPQDTGLASVVVPLNPAALYVLGAWVRTDYGKAAIGAEWVNSKKRFPYSYIAGALNDNQWTYYAGVLKPFEEARGARIWFLNAEGRAYFDDVFFVELSVPACRGGSHR